MSSVGAEQQTAARRTTKPLDWGLVGAIVLAAINLRTAVTSVGPLLDDLEHSIGLSSGLAGLLTTLPVICFAGLGWVTPRMANRLGAVRTLTAALALMTAGLILRVLVGDALLFLLFSVPALAGGAMGNVLLPAMVKRHFPTRVGPVTAVYTTALAVGTTVAAAAVVPIASIGGARSWRVGLGSWAALSALAVVVWLARRPSRDATVGDAPAHAWLLRDSRTAWAMALFFGAQSMQAYIAFGWFANFFQEQAGFSSARAGLLVAFLSALSIPMSMAVPAVAARVRSQRSLVILFVACYVAAYVGMLAAPAAGAWAWALLAGVGGGAFPFALTLIGLRSRGPAVTGALSAFTQSIGYSIAAIGPLLVGVLHGATGGWNAPFVLMFADLVLLAGAGWVVAAPRFVDDEVVLGPVVETGVAT